MMSKLLYKNILKTLIQQLKSFIFYFKDKQPTLLIYGYSTHLQSLLHFLQSLGIFEFKLRRDKQKSQLVK